jgi:hypothetical protein
MPTNADREKTRTSVQHRRAHTGLHAGFGALALSTFIAFAACDSKGSGAPATGAGGKTGSGGSGGSGFGGMMSMGSMGGMVAGMMGTASGGSSGAGGATGEPPQIKEEGMATAKLCNLLVGANDESIDFKLEIGSVPVVLTASSGKCSPPAPTPCAAIPAGNVHVRLSRNGITTAEGIAVITANKPIIGVATLDDQTGRPALGFIDELPANETCESLTLDDPDGGAPGPMPKPDAGIKR